MGTANTDKDKYDHSDELRMKQIKFLTSLNQIHLDYFNVRNLLLSRSIRKTIIGFGTLFNNMEVRHETSDGTTVDIKRVPLAYGPAAKFIARLEQQPDLNKMVAITLPRMSFEMTSIAYDSSRKAGITQTFKAVDNSTNKLKKVFMPVPYNIGFELSLLTKLNDDALQVVEQIFTIFPTII